MKNILKIGKKILKWVLYLLLIPVLYVVFSLVLSFITVDRELENQDLNNTIFLNTNGVHLDIVIPKKHIEPELLSGLTYGALDNYLAFGWGEENFYLHTPTWSDLTFKNAFRAAFLKSTTLMHITRYRSTRTDWIEIKISDAELAKLNAYLLNSFQTDEDESKILLEGQGYSSRDNFYRANGSYSCFKTCNSWVNSGFKESGLKSCLWTPFDFGLMKKYQ